MLHQIPQDHLGPHRDTMARAVQTCVHCGFCLPVCPTYQELGQEMDSPRGRIILMKEVLEGSVPLEQAQTHVDRCLGCLACEPACPSGVPYRDLISPFRALTSKERRPGFMEQLRRKAVTMTLPHPERFRRLIPLARLGKAFRGLVPASMRPMLDLVPDALPDAANLNEIYPAAGQRRGRVALLRGCAQSVLEPGINLATIQVLTQNGVEVAIPASQGCCGALAWHLGDIEAAQACAVRNIGAFPDDVDAIVTNAAGCGSGMQEYGLILEGTESVDAARKLASRVVDVSTYLAKLGLTAKLRLENPVKVAYQDACHLRNAQGVADAPRELLRAVENLDLAEIPDDALCCGSAGTYNIDQPEIAASLGRRKIEAIRETGADWVASGNIGCMTQMKLHARKAGLESLRILHTLEILAEAQTRAT